MQVRSPWCVLVVALPGCWFDATVSTETPRAQITCVTTDDCPAAWSCRPSLGRCLPDDVSDGEPPQLTDASLSASRVTVGDRVTATVTANEPLLELRVFAELGAAVIDWEPTDGVHAHTVDAEEAEGAWTVFADLVDKAGNPSLRQLVGALVVDREAPQIVDAAVAPEIARPGATVTVSIVPSEDASAGVLRVPALGVEATGTLIGDAWAFPVTVPADAADGAYPMSLTSLTDATGNVAADLELPVMFVDGTRIAIVGFDMDRVQLGPTAGFNTLNVTFTLDEAPADLDVRVGEATATCAPPTGLAFDCQWVLNQEPSGVVPVVVSALDAAGNSSSELAAAVIDRDPPELVAALTSTSITLATPRGVVATTAAADGATVIVSVVLRELLGAPPMLSIEGGPQFSTVAFAGTVASFSHVIDAGTDPAGVAALVINAVDRVGNQSTLAVGSGLSLDFTAPASVDVDTPDAVVLQRAPKGDPADPQQAPLTLFLAETAAADGETLVVYDRVVEPRTELARATLTGADQLIALGASDFGAVAVEVIDEAGNASAARRVRDGLLIAVPGMGSGTATLRVAPRVTEEGAGPRTFTGAVAAAGDGLAVRDGVSLQAARSTGVWDLQAPPLAFGGDAVLAWDVERGAAQAFVVGAVREFRGGAWLPVTATNGPPAPLQALAFDPMRGAMIGIGCTGQACTTVAFDGGAFVDLGTSLPFHREPAMAWDRRRQRMMVGGDFCVNENICNGARMDIEVLEDDVWRTIPGPLFGGLPPVRTTLVVDPDLDRVLMFGWTEASTTVAAYAFDADAETFTLLGSSDATLGVGQLVVDRARREIVAVGDLPSGFVSVFDGAGFVPRLVTIDPSVVIGQIGRALYDPIRDITVVLDRFGAPLSLADDVLTPLDIGVPIPASPGAPPVTRAGVDTTAELLVGIGDAGTYLWSGWSWINVGGPFDPIERNGFFSSGAGFDGTFGGAIFRNLVGVLTWTVDVESWNGSGIDPGQPPLPDGKNVEAFDEARGVLVHIEWRCDDFGPCGAASPPDNTLVVSEWHGGWVEVPFTDPSPNPAKRTGAALAYSPAHGRLVYVGGGQGLDWQGIGDAGDSAWAWDGAQWELLSGLPARHNVTLITDRIGGRLLASGGATWFSADSEGNEAALDELWALDAGGWSRLPDPPGRGALPKTPRAGVQDPGTGLIVAEDTPPGVHLFDLSGADPAGVLVDLPRELVPVDASLSRIDVDLSGTTAPIGALRLWDLDHWRVLATATDWDGTTPVTDPGLLALLAADPFIRFAVVGADVRLDALALRVRYRLPP